jgi:hypothetical protein
MRIYEDSALRNDLMKNESMAKRLEFNFCYSLDSNKIPSHKQNSTLNTNVISGPGYQIPLSMMMPQSNGVYREMPEYYFPPKIPSFPQNIDQMHMNPRFQGNFLPNFSNPQMMQPRGQFPVQSDYPSNFSDYAKVHPISPMMNYNFNQRVQNFKKGTIKSDICHDKTSSQFDMGPVDMQDMQQNLVERFKQMKLIPSGNQEQENRQSPGTTGDKVKRPLKLRKKTNRDKENTFPNKEGGKKFKTKQKRRGKIKYKAVELRENKKNEGSKKPKMHSHKIEQKPVLPVSATKSVEELFEGQFGLLGGEDKDTQFGEFECSPRKMNLGSIFDSKLLFDFETPKKSKNDCFLHDNSVKKDSDLKQEYGFSKQKNKILRLFSQSDDEDEFEVVKEKSLFELGLNQGEFSHSIQQMRSTALNAPKRVF